MKSLALQAAEAQHETPLTNVEFAHMHAGARLQLAGSALVTHSSAHVGMDVARISGIPAIAATSRAWVRDRHAIVETTCMDTMVSQNLARVIVQLSCKPASGCRGTSSPISVWSDLQPLHELWLNVAYGMTESTVTKGGKYEVFLNCEDKPGSQRPLGIGEFGRFHHETIE